VLIRLRLGLSKGRSPVGGFCESFLGWMKVNNFTQIYKKKWRVQAPAIQSMIFKKTIKR
jgi:hypothetical protein